MDIYLELIGLFSIGLIAATLIPAGSEAFLAILAANKNHSLMVLLGVASAGNILGSVINYWLGIHATRFQDRNWFPVSAIQMDRAQKWFHRWGQWSQLLAWVPVIGDPLTLVAGVMKMPFLRFLALVSISKIGRYIVVLGLVDQFI